MLTSHYSCSYKIQKFKFSGLRKLLSSEVVIILIYKRWENQTQSYYSINDLQDNITLSLYDAYSILHKNNGRDAHQQATHNRNWFTVLQYTNQSVKPGHLFPSQYSFTSLIS